MQKLAATFSEKRKKNTQRSGEVNSPLEETITRREREKEDLERERYASASGEREIGCSDQECSNKTGIVENKRERELDQWSYVMNIKNRKFRRSSVGEETERIIK